MNKFVGVISLVMIQLVLGGLLTACVELKDPDSEANAVIPPAPLQLQEAAPDLEVDGDLYVYQDKIMTLDQIDRMNYKTRADWTPGTQTKTYRRITFTSRGKLYTMGNNLKLIADEIFSDRGEILSFPAGVKAEVDHRGLDGGFLTLQARHAEGLLFVTMRGQDGGDGREAVQNSTHYPIPKPCNHDEAATHAQPGWPGGRGGDSGSIRILGEKQPLFDMRVRREFGHGGKGGAASKASFCFRIPGDSFYGNSAPDGAPGADGTILE